MDIHYKPIPPVDCSRRTMGFINAYNCILANHMFHEGTDDYGGYPGSDLCQENEAALWGLTKIIEQNRLRDLQVVYPTWMWIIVSVVSTFCALHLAGVTP